MQLKVVPPGEIQVVVPQRLALKHVEPFVAEHHEWIMRTLQQVQHQYAGHDQLPEQIEFAALGDCWQVIYQEAARGHIKELPNFVLRVSGRDAQHQRQALQHWLQLHAKRSLQPWLNEVSQELKMPYAKLSIRAQKGRWGSCSSRGNISLNRAMLFLEPMAVRYLLIHELCHTRYMNHSAAYWQLVAQCMPDYKHYDRQLKHALKTVPAWALY